MNSYEFCISFDVCEVVTRCFCHENIRVYGDRLTTEEDRGWLRGKLDGQLKNSFGLDPLTVFDKETSK